MKNIFSNKSNKFETITLVENNVIISNDQKIADIFIKYFDAIAPKLGLAIPKDVIFAANGMEDHVLKAAHKYQRHPSIFAIKEKHKDLNFSFCSVSLHCVKSVQIRSFFWSVFGHFSRSVI